MALSNILLYYSLDARAHWANLTASIWRVLALGSGASATSNSTSQCPQRTFSGSQQDALLFVQSRSGNKHQNSYQLLQQHTTQSGPAADPPSTHPVTTCPYTAAVHTSCSQAQRPNSLTKKRHHSCQTPQCLASDQSQSSPTLASNHICQSLPCLTCHCRTDHARPCHLMPINTSLHISLMRPVTADVSRQFRHLHSRPKRGKYRYQPADDQTSAAGDASPNHSAPHRSTKTGLAGSQHLSRKAAGTTNRTEPTQQSSSGPQKSFRLNTPQLPARQQFALPQLDIDPADPNLKKYFKADRHHHPRHAEPPSTSAEEQAASSQERQAPVTLQQSNQSQASDIADASSDSTDVTAPPQQSVMQALDACNSMAKLCEVVQNHAEQLKTSHVVRALFRIVNLRAVDAAASQPEYQAPLVDLLVAKLQQPLIKREISEAQLSNILASLVKLKLPNSTHHHPVFRMLTERGFDVLWDASGPAPFCKVLWAATKLRYLEPGFWAAATALVLKKASRAPLTPYDWSSILWAFCSAKYYEVPVCDALVKQALNRKLQGGTPHDWATIMWALAQFSHYSRPFCTHVVKQVLAHGMKDAKPAEWSILLASFAKLGHYSKELCDLFVRQSKDGCMSLAASLDISDPLWALAVLRHYDHDAVEALLSRMNDFDADQIMPRHGAFVFYALAVFNHLTDAAVQLVPAVQGSMLLGGVRGRDLCYMLWSLSVLGLVRQHLKLVSSLVLMANSRPVDSFDGPSLRLLLPVSLYLQSIEVYDVTFEEKLLLAAAEATKQQQISTSTAPDLVFRALKRLEKSPDLQSVEKDVAVFDAVQKPVDVMVTLTDGRQVAVLIDTANDYLANDTSRPHGGTMLRNKLFAWGLGAGEDMIVCIKESDILNCEGDLALVQQLVLPQLHQVAKLARN